MAGSEGKSKVTYTPHERKWYGNVTNVIQSNLISTIKDMRATSNLDQARSFAPAETAPVPKTCYYLNPINSKGAPIVPSRRRNMSLLAYAISKFYPLIPLDDITNEDFLVGLASIILACTNFSINPQWDELKNAMKTSMININFVPITPGEINDLQTRDPGLKELQKLFGAANYVNLIENSEAFLIIGSIILVTIGKNIDPRYYDKWVANRVKGFCGALGQQTIAGKLTIDCSQEVT